jgi:hypothetical protein
MTTYVVSYRDGIGPASFNLTATAPAASQTMTKLAGQCNPCIARRKGLNGKPLRCDKLSQPDGSMMVVEEIASLETDPPALAKVKALDAIHYRTDGSTVNIVNDMLVSGRLGCAIRPARTGRHGQAQHAPEAAADRAAADPARHRSGVQPRITSRHRESRRGTRPVPRSSPGSDWDQANWTQPQGR